MKQQPFSIIQQDTMIKQAFLDKALQFGRGMLGRVVPGMARKVPPPIPVSANMFGGAAARGVSKAPGAVAAASDAVARGGRTFLQQARAALPYAATLPAYGAGYAMGGMDSGAQATMEIMRQYGETPWYKRLGAALFPKELNRAITSTPVSFWEDPARYLFMNRLKQKMDDAGMT